jgi:hypothetical protein
MWVLHRCRSFDEGSDKENESWENIIHFGLLAILWYNSKNKLIGKYMNEYLPERFLPIFLVVYSEKVIDSSRHLMFSSNIMVDSVL